jgi:hypothetical protein
MSELLMELKGHSHEKKVVEIIALNDRIDPN